MDRQIFAVCFEYVFKVSNAAVQEKKAWNRHIERLWGAFWKSTFILVPFCAELNSPQNGMIVQLGRKKEQ